MTDSYECPGCGAKDLTEEEAIKNHAQKSHGQVKRISKGPTVKKEVK